MEDAILFRAIVEVVGKPKEYVEKAIKTIIEHAKQVEGLKLEKQEIEEATSLKSEKLPSTEEKIQKAAGELFSTFAELEFKAKNLDSIGFFCFDFMPSSIEIIEPENISLKMQQLSRFMNDFLSKVHNADMAVKRLNFENAALKNNAGLLLRNMIIVSVKSKEKNLDDLSKAVGIPSEQLKPFVDSLVNEKFIKEEKGIYKPK